MCNNSTYIAYQLRHGSKILTVEYDGPPQLVQKLILGHDPERILPAFYLYVSGPFKWLLFEEVSLPDFLQPEFYFLCLIYVTCLNHMFPHCTMTSNSVWFHYFVGHIFFPNIHELLLLYSVSSSSTTIQTVQKNCYGCV